MEEDRIATNLGPETNGEVETEVTAPAKQPKRRFVGRRTADQAAQSSGANGSIEDSGAMQGVNNPTLHIL
jgi:2-(3-amino-3-carboxypropyl)histidine synthase